MQDSTRCVGGRRLSSALPFVFFIIAAQAAGALGAIATRKGMAWNDTLEKPSFNPPGWVFGPVWTVLYFLMAMAAWLVWRKKGPGAKPALGLWGVQLALNLAWSWIYFGAQRPGAAVIEIVALLGAIVATMAAFLRIERVAGLLMLPYLAWVAFAAVLNWSIWRLN
jgi:tryptophan-rich sensory protein